MDDTKMDRCLCDLRITDPRVDKGRIEASKDSILKDCYSWILDDPAFQQWKDDNDTRLLWIKGDPGKGKTMMMIGLVKELSEYADSTPRSGISSYLLKKVGAHTTPRHLVVIFFAKALILD
jgi:hypothetical protein